MSDFIALQQDLNALVQWSLSWQMTFNPQKCEFIRIMNKKNPIAYKYYIGSTLINEVSCSKYLGVTIDHKLSWNEHIRRVTIQVNAFLYRT